MPDDYAGDTSTTGSVAIGGSTPGNIETAYDEDWFAVSLTAGVSYEFVILGNVLGLAEPRMSLQASDGSDVSYHANGCDDYQTVFHPNTPIPGYVGSFLVNYSATTTGTYYLNVYSNPQYPGGTGQYEVFATALTEDDYVGSTLTTESLAVGASTTGDIESFGDTDWVAVTLIEGVTYQFDLRGDPAASSDPLMETALYLRASDGSEIEYDQGSGGFQGDDEAGWNSRIVYTATATGTYYPASEAVAEPFLNPPGDDSPDTGTYELSAVALTHKAYYWAEHSSSGDFYYGYFYDELPYTVGYLSPTAAEGGGVWNYYVYNYYDGYDSTLTGYNYVTDYYDYESGTWSVPYYFEIGTYSGWDPTNPISSAMEYAEISGIYSYFDSYYEADGSNLIYYWALNSNGDYYYGYFYDDDPYDYGYQDPTASETGG